MFIVNSQEQIHTPTAIALGNFDGIHRGHQIVLQPILSLAHQPREHVFPSVVSFLPHPREFFTGDKLQLLTPVAEKRAHLAKMGIEQLILLSFDQKLASLSPQQFVQQVIVEQLQAIKVSVGQDFRFGYQRQGTAADLKNIATDLGIEVVINRLHKC